MDKLMVLDGDFESELYRHLEPSEKETPTFVLHALKYNQDAVYKTHLAYLRAGAQIIRTNTYRASSQSLSRCLKISLSESMSLISETVRIAKMAVAKYYQEMGGNIMNISTECNRPLIAGACGSYSSTTFSNMSDILLDANYLSTTFMWNFHRERVRTLWLNNVDLLAFESISSWNETVAIVKTLKEFPAAHAWITFLCSQDGLLCDRTYIATVTMFCCEALPQGQIIAIGIERDAILTPLKRFVRNFNANEILNIPLVICPKKHDLLSKKPNEHIMTPQYGVVQEWLNDGARYVGGGTGTVAEDIKEIRKQVDNYRMLSDNKFTTLTTYDCLNKNKQTKL